MTLFAIDPGPHTGVVWRSVDGEFHATTLDFTRVETHEGIYQLSTYLYRVIEPTDEIILESFEYRKDENNREYIDYRAAEYVGAVKLFCMLTGTKLVNQSAAVAKGFWSDDKLKRVGLYIVCDSKHTRDAMRHYLKYITFTLKNNSFLHLLRKGQ